MSNGKEESLLPVTQAPLPSSSGGSRSPGSKRTIGLASLPAVSRSGSQFTLTPRDQPRYESEGVLGRGGMGEVRLARDQDIGRRVAIKRMLDENSPQAVARFIDEIRTVGQLEHPNIVPIHDVGVDTDGTLFFVMKYVDGETLASVIERLRRGDVDYRRRYGFEARLDIFLGLLRALQYAHRQGMLHRDVKPANILIGQYGEVMLTDWGIARNVGHGQSSGSDSDKGMEETMSRAAEETAYGSIVGTPGYMSPEQASGRSEEVDARSDLYGAFSVLYELLTTRPFVPRGTSSQATIENSLRRKAPRILDRDYWSSHQPAVPVELRHLLNRGLQPAKSDRFQTADEVLSLLERIRSGSPPIQCAGTLIKATNARFERMADSHPILSATVYASVGCLVLIGIITTCMAALGP